MGTEAECVSSQKKMWFCWKESGAQVQITAGVRRRATFFGVKRGFVRSTTRSLQRHGVTENRVSSVGSRPCLDLTATFANLAKSCDQQSSCRALRDSQSAPTKFRLAIRPY